MKIVCGSTSRGIAQDLAKVTGAEFIQANIKHFPDGEAYVRIERDSLVDDVVIVQNTHPDSNLVEMLLLSNAARGLGASRIIMVIPYFGYARQDRRFNPGEALSAQVMLRHMEIESDKLLTVDLHKPDTLKWFTKAPSKDVSAAPSIGRYFQDRGIELVLAPDIGAASRVAEVAKMLGAETDHLIKTRLSGTEVNIAPSQVNAINKKVLIVDDIISTGGTIIAATHELKRLGARSVTAACTHGLFTYGALERLKGVCDSVVCTNTLESEASKISVAQEIAQAL